MIHLATSREFPFLTDEDQALLAALRARGCTAAPLVWTDPPPHPPGAGDVVVVRSCWDYHLQPGRFQDWIADVEARGATLANGGARLRWNMDKRYLLELRDRHAIAVPPTAWVARGAAPDLRGIAAALATDDLVVKPSVSLSAFETWRTAGGVDAAAQERFGRLSAERDLIVQPYLPQVQDGELSLVFFDGVYSHAVRKRPAPGDFRVQADFGGTRVAARPPSRLIAQAARVLDAAGGPFPYARVDALDVDGELLLMELELIDPVLFLAFGGAPALSHCVEALLALAARAATPHAAEAR